MTLIEQGKWETSEQIREARENAAALVHHHFG
jgi:hypothetical protein